MSRLTFVTGGARSGKSRYAEELAAASGSPVTYIATMVAGDPELEARVAHHRARRPAAWATIDAPLDPPSALAKVAPGTVVLLDCLSLWISNALFDQVPDPDAATVAEWEAFVDGCDVEASQVLTLQRACAFDLIVVTNEVGLGIVPASPLSRWYRDALGLVNQRFARAADEAILMVSGRPLRLP